MKIWKWKINKFLFCIGFLAQNYEFCCEILVNDWLEAAAFSTFFLCALSQQGRVRIYSLNGRSAGSSNEAKLLVSAFAQTYERDRGRQQLDFPLFQVPIQSHVHICCAGKTGFAFPPTKEPIDDRKWEVWFGPQNINHALRGSLFEFAPFRFRLEVLGLPNRSYSACPFPLPVQMFEGCHVLNTSNDFEVVSACPFWFPVKFLRVAFSK